MRIVVVLPAPFGPRKPKISPSFTCRSTPRTASTMPLRPLKLLANPFVSIIAILITPFCLFVLSVFIVRGKGVNCRHPFRVIEVIVQSKKDKGKGIKYALYFIPYPLSLLL